MGRVYAERDDTGERFLLHLECDVCPATLAPGPDVGDYGWVKLGWDEGPGTTKFVTYLCSQCAQERLRH